MTIKMNTLARSRRAMIALSMVLLAGAQLLGRAPLAHADTYTVCPSGCSYTTIQAAVGAAVSQDQATGQHASVITVGAGTYTGGISFPGDTAQAPGYRSFTLQAAPGAQVLITGNSFNQVLTIFGAPTVTIQGITIENGLGQTGGGIQVTSGATVSLVGDTLQGNRALDGAGIYVNGATLTLSNTTLENNDTQAGVGQDSHGGGLYASNSTVTIKNSSFLGNVVQSGRGADATSAGGAGAPGHSGFGGGIYTNGGSLSVDASTFFGNRALGGTGGDGNGGGAGGQGGSGNGGALYTAGALTVIRSTLSGNGAQGGLGGSGGSGGAAGYGNGGALISVGTPAVV
ncbi:MAG TPA: right-handed parallel beta-helix repeat-containing protein, partial [Chloroflexota bacterium]|nr:right-handed parallel beta-helix repeat-containing protein [Chloroflexota bacterium]